MPDTKADIERLKHHWEQGACAWDDTYADELLAIAARLLRERTDAREHACKAIATAMGARELLVLLITGIRGLLADAHVIQERDEEQGLVTLSKVVHAESLAALLNPEGTNDEKPQEG